MLLEKYQRTEPQGAYAIQLLLPELELKRKGKLGEGGYLSSTLLLVQQLNWFCSLVLHRGMCACPAVPMQPIKF